MTTRIWHNPRCSKSRATLSLLQDHGYAPEIILYLEVPSKPEQIEEALTLLGMLSARELMRKGEAEYKDNSLDNPELSESELISALLTNPKLIERPIVFANGKAAIGRPPESVLRLWEK